MNKFILKLSLILFLLGSIASCSSDNGDKWEPTGTEAEIVSYSIKGYSEQADFDSKNRNISLRLPEIVTSGTGLIPEFSLSDGATLTLNGKVQESGVTAINFNSIISYTVIAEDNKTQTNWKVNVTNNNYTVDWGLGHFLSSSRSNEGSRSSSWYLQQQHTGEHSNRNCGPTAVTMAAMWADASFNKSVEDARNAIPISNYGDKTISWYPQDILDYLVDNSINARIEMLSISENGAQNQFQEIMFSHLDNNDIVVICVNMSNIKNDESINEDYRVGKYHTLTGGHFLVVKGYRIVDSNVLFEVHDPWGLDLKYGDGTYKGENRYYSNGDLYNAVITHNKRLVIVSL